MKIIRKFIGKLTSPGEIRVDTLGNTFAIPERYVRMDQPHQYQAVEQNFFGVWHYKFEWIGVWAPLPAFQGVD